MELQPSEYSARQIAGRAAAQQRQITLPDISVFLLVLKAVDEGEDLFAPHGFTRKNLVEALSTAYEAVAAIRQEVHAVPKATIIKIGLGLFDTITGVLEVISIVESR